MPGSLKHRFALWSVGLMTKRAGQVVEAFPSRAINRNETGVLVQEVAVALAAAFWAGVLCGVWLGMILMGILCLCLG